MDASCWGNNSVFEFINIENEESGCVRYSEMSNEQSVK